MGFRVVRGALHRLVNASENLQQSFKTVCYIKAHSDEKSSVFIPAEMRYFLVAKQAMPNQPGTPQAGQKISHLC